MQRDKRFFKSFAVGHDVEEKLDNPIFSDIAESLYYGEKAKNPIVQEILEQIDVKKYSHVTKSLLFPTLDATNLLGTSVLNIIKRAKEEVEQEEQEQGGQGEDQGNEQNQQEGDEGDQGGQGEDGGEGDGGEGDGGEGDGSGDSSNDSSGDGDSSNDGSGEQSKGSKGSQSNQSQSKSAGQGQGQQVNDKKVLEKVLEMFQRNSKETNDLKNKVDEALGDASKNGDVATELMSPDKTKYDQFGTKNLSQEQVMERNELASRIEAVRSSAKLKNLLSVFGNLTKVMHSFNVKNNGHGSIEPVGMMLGNHIPDIVPSEFANLVGIGDPEIDELLELAFLQRLVNQEVLQFEKKEKTKRGKGDLFLTLDVSGSMSTPMRFQGQYIPLYVIGFGLALAIMVEMRRQNRRMVFETFSYKAKRIFDTGSDSWKGCFTKAIRGVEEADMGGTDFDEALSSYIRTFKESKRRHVDLMFITDGICHVSTNIKKQMRELRTSDMFSYGVLLGEGDGYGAVKDIQECLHEFSQAKDVEQLIAFAETAFSK